MNCGAIPHTGGNLVSTIRDVCTGRQGVLSSRRDLGSYWKLHEGDRDGALRWLTSPVLTLASERLIDRLIAEPGRRALQQVIHALEHGLPV